MVYNASGAFGYYLSLFLSLIFNTNYCIYTVMYTLVQCTPLAPNPHYIFAFGLSPSLIFSLSLSVCLPISFPDFQYILLHYSMPTVHWISALGHSL